MEHATSLLGPAQYKTPVFQVDDLQVIPVTRQV